MKSDTQILNELAAKSDYLHVLTVEESKNLKQMLLSMYKDIAALCEQNGISFMLGGGSCLGAIRHQGFIPWDDDLDLMMMRKDYETLITLCKQGALGENYEIDTPSKDKDCKNPYLKIYRKGTLDNELYNENTPFPKGVFIDVFPMDFAPKYKWQQRLKGLMSDALQVICTCVLYSEYPSGKYLEFISQSPEMLKRYKLRLLIGKIFGLIPHKKWTWWFDQLNASSSETNYVTIPTGRKRYFGEIRKRDIYFPVVFLPFEGIYMPVCGKYHEYLTSMYGNYMELPPIGKRERHFVHQFKCEI